MRDHADRSGKLARDMEWAASRYGAQNVHELAAYAGIGLDCTTQNSKNLQDQLPLFP